MGATATDLLVSLDDRGSAAPFGRLHRGSFSTRAGSNDHHVKPLLNHCFVPRNFLG
jgi:hypothetical protein